MNVLLIYQLTWRDWLYSTLSIRKHGILFSILTIAFYLALKDTPFYWSSVFLAALLVVDYQCQRLPDIFTLPLLLLGAFISFLYSDVFYKDLLASLYYFCVFWVVSYLSYRHYGQIALGGGDIKIIAAMPFIFGFEVVTIGIIVAGFLQLLAYVTLRKKSNDFMAYGPSLIIGIVGAHIYWNFW